MQITLNKPFTDSRGQCFLKILTPTNICDMINLVNETILFLGETAAKSPGFSSQFIVMGMLVLGMWFLLIAPQRKKQKQHAKMIAALGSGDHVITNAGIYGTITNVKDDRFVLKIADNTKIEINKSFVQTKVENTDKESN